MLHAAFVRSPVARGVLRSVDISEAMALDGVYAVVTAADINHLQGDTWQWLNGPGSPGPPWRPLADGDVRYVGEPIAIVIATSRYLAEDGCDLVHIDVASSRPVVTARDALAADAAVVHPELGSNVAGEVDALDDPRVDAAFAAAAHVVGTTVSMHRHLPVPMETRGLVSEFEAATSQLRIVMSAQAVHETARFFARYTGLPRGSVHVKAGDVGGGFGQKAFPMREECCIVLASKALSCALKWIEDRNENLVAASQSRDEFADVRIAVDADGRILAIDVQHMDNVGAFPVAGTSSSSQLVHTMLTGPYRIPLVRFSSRSAYTNTTGRAPYRGPWLMESVIREVALELTARTIGLSSVDIRRRNVITDGDLPYTNPGGHVYEAVTPAANLERAAAAIDVDAFRTYQAAEAKSGRYLGLGLGLYIEPSGMAFAAMATESANVRVLPGGQVQVIVSAVSHGHSLETTIPQVVAEYLGVELDAVVLIQADSEATPYGSGVGGSRSAVNFGSAARQAAEKVRAKVLQIGAQMMEAAVDDVTINAGRIHVKGSPARSLTMADIADFAYFQPNSLPAGVEPALEELGHYSAPPFTYSNSCHACICELDVTTGLSRIMRYVVSEDCGTIINPMVVDGQIDGGVVQGIGGVLYEQMIYDSDGTPLSTTFMDYLLPTAIEVPIIEHDHLETPAPGNASGFKGMGEGGVIGSTPAVANAVFDALALLGINCTRLPLGPQEVLELLDAQDRLPS
jgi:carbon-monoxide dehydrogenase large subunit